MATDAIEFEAAGRTVKISHPEKVIFPAIGVTKLDLANYYLAVAEPLLEGVRDRPCVMKRYPEGQAGDSFYQKRVPKGRPEWIETAVVHFPSGNSAEELCPTDVAHIIWSVNLGCIEVHPWAVRRGDLDHPDELRVDLDPQPGTDLDDLRHVMRVVHERLEAHGLDGTLKTSGSRGLHVFAPIEARWDFSSVRRAALALGREVERQLPDIATTAWWKEERGERIFIDYNQNARDRTVAAAWSVRPVPDARVSCPISWDELDDVEPALLTVKTVPEILASRGDPGARLSDRRFSLESLLEQADRDDASGVVDQPWPPYTPGRRPPRS